MSSLQINYYCRFVSPWYQKFIKIFLNKVFSNSSSFVRNNICVLKENKVLYLKNNFQTILSRTTKTDTAVGKKPLLIKWDSYTLFFKWKTFNAKFCRHEHIWALLRWKTGAFVIKVYGWVDVSLAYRKVFLLDENFEAHKVRLTVPAIFPHCDQNVHCRGFTGFSQFVQDSSEFLGENLFFTWRQVI